MKYNFSDRVRKALAIAREIVIEGGHEAVFVEHIAAGILDAGGEEIQDLLVATGVDSARLREGLDHALAQRPSRPGGHGHAEYPYTSRSKRALERAMRVARDLKAPSVTTGMLLVGALEADEQVRELAAASGLELEPLRSAVAQRLVGSLEGPPPSTSEERPVFVVDVDPEADEPIYEQIVARVEEAVAKGLLLPGEQLPPVRQMAGELSTAPGTVARAYRILEERGVVVTEGARGTRVAPRPTKTGRSQDAVTHNLVGLLRPVAVAAYHLGASAEQLREALESAMKGILVDPLEEHRELE